jgi:hypothetical protein
MAPSGKPDNRKWAWGCLGGLVAFVTIAALLVAVGCWLLVAPLPVVPPEAFLAGDASGFLSVRIEPDDELMSGFPVRVAMAPAFQQVAQTQPGEEPEEVVEFTRKIQSMAPLQVVALLAPGGTGGEFRAGVAACVSRYSRVLRMFLATRTDLAAAPTTHEGVSIESLPDGSFFASRRNNFLVANDLGVITRWIDRLEEQYARMKRGGRGAVPIPEPGGRSALRDAYTRLDRSYPVLFACENGNGELQHLLSRAPDGPVTSGLREAGLASPQVRSVRGQLRPTASARLEVSAWLECADPESAAALEMALLGVLTRLSEDRSAFRVTREEPQVVRASGTIPDAPAKLAAAAAKWLGQPLPAAPPLGPPPETPEFTAPEP